MKQSKLAPKDRLALLLKWGPSKSAAFRVSTGAPTQRRGAYSLAKLRSPSSRTGFVPPSAEVGSLANLRRPQFPSPKEGTAAICTPQSCGKLEAGGLGAPYLLLGRSRERS